MTRTDIFFEWIKSHLTDNTTTLRLKYSGRKDDTIDYSDAITQIECRRKFSSKLNETLSKFPDFYFPTQLAGEQATSDLLASYHAGFIESGSSVADLTAGLGIDVFHLSETAGEVVAIEIDKNRADALKYNCDGLGLKNVSVIEGDCRDFIEQCNRENKKFDYIFIDPARRDDVGKRIFALEDCRPDVVAMLPILKEISKQLIIKASPMLDISAVLKSLGDSVYKVVALGTKTECKELDIILNFERTTDNPKIDSVTLSSDSSNIFSFNFEDENLSSDSYYGLPVKNGDYVYESFPCVMKSGAFNVLCREFDLLKFHANTRLLYSDTVLNDFPGKIYKILEVLPYASKVIKRLRLKYPKAGIAVRNFGMSAEALRQKLAIKEGDEIRIYGITDRDGSKKLLVCES